MIAIRVDTNVAGVSRALQSFFSDQLPFAISKAINNTAKDAQQAHRAHMAGVFTIRRPDWVNRAIKIKPFASKRRLTATIQVEPLGGQSRADILTRHERTGQRTPVRGKALAVALAARPTKQQLVPKDLRPKRLGFNRVQTAGDVEIYRGQRRTFMVRNADGSGWILRRTGRGAHSRLFQGTQVLFVLRPRTPIIARLDFEGTVSSTVARRFQMHLQESFLQAVRTARR